MPDKIYFTPGPSQLFHSFQDHFRSAIKENVANISHRSTQFIKIIEETNEAIRELLQIPEGYHLFFLNSANEAWDRIIQNLVIESSHHFVNGAFSRKFYDFAIRHGMRSTRTQPEDGESYDNFNIPEKAELIGLAKNETSVGFTFTEAEIEKIRQEHSDKLIALDIVSASPALPVNFSTIDTAYFSVQKAFGMPAGLGVWIVNERCVEKSLKKAEKTSIGSYRSIPTLKKFGSKAQTPETPGMIYIYVLGKIARDILNYGVKRMQNDIVYKAAIINQTIENHPSLAHFVSSEKHRSLSSIVAKANNPSVFFDAISEKGMILGKGYGVHEGEHIRIANFPAHSRESIEYLCDLIGNLE
ncbi:MAG: aminotransferase class V-fold PLP-dependent enzyme [Ekhidna sp.]|nr:aminotransferase class V-fold PLP-dependent enzyme [Ekhidna sp.]MBC6410088.1 aminotransferase class V-fold PLP-dependent enzyme [Ekhidna sp.]MBC6425108.1 aminotransferase class V-fold PLP-dependent enzyme [Ekhidna sp.]